MGPPSKTSQSVQSGTSFLHDHRRSPGSQNVQNIQPVCGQGCSDFDESHLRSNDAVNRGDEILECSQGHTRSQDVHSSKELMATGRRVVTTENHYSKLAQGYPRSNDRSRCINCGHVSSSIINVEAEILSAELGKKQVSVATHESSCSDGKPVLKGTADSQRSVEDKNVSQLRVDALQSRCSGQNSESQGRVGTLESRCSVTRENVSQGKVVTGESRGSGRENAKDRMGTAESGVDSQETMSQGKVVAVESRSGGRDWLKMESYKGVVSRQLCEQLLQLMKDVDTARDYYYNVQVLLRILLL